MIYLNGSVIYYSDASSAEGTRRLRFGTTLPACCIFEKKDYI